MGKFKVTENCNGIAGLKVIEPSVFGDARGYFMETYQYNDFKEAGIDCTFVQDNQSASKKGVLRGLHFQIHFPQDKLVRVINGEVFDVAVDLREFFYKVTDFYHPNDEGGLLWNDPKIGVEWPIPEGMTKQDLILSDKDKVWGGIDEYAAGKR